ncbi:NAD-dependent epimerase/dehydratase family protein [Patescibacteria group bacterium]|jgi:UDP-glucose 4-epimerase|nr:NAD-dependent epimerase/dehydratase family protein [Patescibacteria group bacterium]
MAKRVLVTGGAGFIGSHLCEALVRDASNEVYSLDNYSTGSESNHIQGVTYLRGDTRDIERMVEFTPDMIFHLGEYSRTSQSFLEPEKTWRQNAEGTFCVLEFCRKKKVGKLLYAGSSTKQADGGDGRNQSPYAWTKAANTELIQRYHEWYGLPFVTVYFYNVYGGREIQEGPYATLIGIFKRLRREGKPLPVVSPGTQYRSFTHVDDIVRGILLAAEKGQGDGYCLGPKEMHTIREVAEMFGGEIAMLPEKPGDRKNVSIDLSKTEEELGWRAQIRLQDHIRDFLKTLV